MAQDIWQYLKGVTNMDVERLLPLVEIYADANGHHTIKRWDVPGVKKPTDEELNGGFTIPRGK